MVPTLYLYTPYSLLKWPFGELLAISFVHQKLMLQTGGLHLQESAKSVHNSSPPGHAVWQHSKPSILGLLLQNGLQLPQDVCVLISVILSSNGDEEAAKREQVASKKEGDVHEPVVSARKASFWQRLELHQQARHVRSNTWGSNMDQVTT